jgi:hypothetical protein
MSKIGQTIARYTLGKITKKPVHINQPKIVKPKKTSRLPKKKIGIISDVHGNLSALESALSEMRSKGTETLRCLGDFVGYGGDPVECLNIIRTLKSGYVCGGNHDLALRHSIGGDEALKALEIDDQVTVYDQLIGYNMNKVAARTVYLSAKEVEKLPKQQREEIVRFLKGLPDIIQIGNNAKGIHGFKEDPKNSIGLKYVIPHHLIDRYGIENKQTIADPARIILNSKLFDDNTRAIFTGHVHIPFGFYISKDGHISDTYVPGDDPEDQEEMARERERRKKRGEDAGGLIGRMILRPGERIVVNVGAIGISRRQELDILQNAWGYRTEDFPQGMPILPGYYVTFDGATIEFYEFYYDYTRTFAGISDKKMPNIFLGETYDDAA